MFGVSAGKTLCRDDFPSQAGCELMYFSTQSALKCPLKDRTMKKTSDVRAFCSSSLSLLAAKQSFMSLRT